MSAEHHRPPEGTAALMAEVFSGATRLLRGEIALARAEVAQKMRSAAFAMVQFVVAVILGISATNLLAGAGVAALVGLGVSTAMAALLMAGALLLAAYGFVRWGLYLLSPAHLTPTASLTNLGRDAAVLKSMVNPDDQS